MPVALLKEQGGGPPLLDVARNRSEEEEHSFQWFVPELKQTQLDTWIPSYHIAGAFIYGNNKQIKVRSKEEEIGKKKSSLVTNK
jgi:hypothetical protein